MLHSSQDKARLAVTLNSVFPPQKTSELLKALPAVSSSGRKTLQKNQQTSELRVVLKRSDAPRVCLQGSVSDGGGDDTGGVTVLLL